MCLTLSPSCGFYLTNSQTSTRLPDRRKFNCESKQINYVIIPIHPSDAQNSILQGRSRGNSIPTLCVYLRFQEEFQIVVGSESLQERLTRDIDFDRAGDGLRSGRDRNFLVFLLILPPFIGTMRRIFHGRVASSSVMINLSHHTFDD